MEKNEALAIIAGVSSIDGAESTAPTNLHVVTGEVVSNSEDGVALIEPDGIVFSENDSQYIEVDTLGGLEEGDVATIVLAGQEGRGMTPLAIGAVGSVDRISGRVASIEADYINAEYLEANYIDADTIDANYATVANLSAATGRISDLEADHVSVDDLSAATARIGAIEADYLVAADMTAEQARVGNLLADYTTTTDLQATYATITNLNAATGRISDLEADHVSVSDFEAEQANIDNLQAATADIATIRANSAKVQNLTAAQLEADHATVGSLSTTYATISNLDAATGRIGTLEANTADIATIRANSAKVANLTAAQLEADHATVNNLDANYAQIDLANVNNAWIDNGVIAEAAISSAQIAGVSANKLTAGTINGSVINVTNLNATNITTGTLNGQRIGTGSLSLDKLSEDVYTEAEVDSIVDGLNARIDSQIETWTVDAVPTLNNSPASAWTTNDLKAEHVGDICYVINASSDYDGYTYRFAYDNSTNQYQWVLIKDNQVTAALGRITDLETFESTTSTWITETDEGLETIRSNHTTLSGRVDKVVKSSIQLWYTKANTTAPSAPTSAVTSTSTSGNAWRTVVPTYNSSYPYYYYCWQYQYEDGTYGWSAVIYDRATSESEERARTGVANAATAQTTANANIKTSVQLWYTKTDTTAPSKPNAQVTTSNASTKGAWNLVVPTYASSNPYYFYCYQQQKGDGTYQWTDVVYDEATSTAMKKAQEALPASTFQTFEQSTFKDVVDTVDEQTTSITQLTTIATNNGLTENTNISNTVNTVSQTASGNSSKISNLTTTIGANADGTNPSTTSVIARTSAIEQDLSGFKTTVSETYATQSALATTNGNVTTAQNTANTANNKQVAFSATSSTGATTAAKVAACTNFPALAAGATVTVRFSAANTSTGAITLNVNSTGAKTVYVNGAATSSSNQLLWAANANVTFTYDGTYWRVDSEPRSWYGTGAVEAGTAAKTATINEIVICKGTSVTLNMTYENTSTSATLNVTSTGAKNIYYGTTTTRPTTANGYGWTANSTVTLIFDGAYWRLGDTSALAGLVTANSTLSSHTTSIQQNASDIALKANATDVYTKTQTDGLISTEVTNRNSAIQQSADSITSTVAATYTTKTEFANLEIGGRNLIRNTATYDNWAGTSSANYVTLVDDAGGMFARVAPPSVSWTNMVGLSHRPVELLNGRTVTISCDVRGHQLPSPAVSNSFYLNIQAYATDGTSARIGTIDNSYSSSVLVEDEWVRATKTLTFADDARTSFVQVPSGYTYENIAYFDAAIYNHSTISIDFRHLKVEYGTKSTDWTPAPEDMATQEQVTTLNTAIEQNAEDIALRATKTEAYQSAQPNLSPFFESTPYRTATTYDGGYWQKTADNWLMGGITHLSDGWAHVTRAASTRLELAIPYIDSIDSSKKYTLLFEWRDITVTGSPNLYARNYPNNCQFTSNSYNCSWTTSSPTSGTKRVSMTVDTTAKATAWTAAINLGMNNGSGVSFDGDLRISLYEETQDADGNWVQYTGPYKPYSGTQLYASQAELKVANDSISAKVDKNGVIASINASVEQSGGSAVKIQADKVDIQGAAIFQSGGYLNQTSLNNAYDSKGSAAAVQTNLNNVNRSCQVGQSTSTTTNPWYKVASTSITAQYYDHVIVFDVFNAGGYVGSQSAKVQSGRLMAHIRAADGVNAIEAPYVAWDNRSATIDPSDFVLAYKLTAGTSVDAELWCKCPYAYKGYRFDVVYEGNRTAKVPGLWTLYNTWSAGSQSAITSGYTQVVSVDANSAQLSVDELELVGRNLLTKTGTIFPKTGTSSAYFIECNTANGYLANSVVLEVGQTYTFSVDVTSTVEPFRMSVGAGNGNYAKDIAWGNGFTSGRASLTFTVTSDHVSNGNVFAFRAPRYDTSGTSFTYTVSNPKLEKGDRATDWTPAPEDSIFSEQRIYYRTSTTLSSSTQVGSWVTYDGTANNTWSTKRMQYDSTYKYLYTCIQRQTVGGAITNTTVLLDDTTTVIDGGNIITGTVTANQIAAGAITAQKLNVGDMQNYSALDEQTASYYGFTYDETSDGRWYTMTSLKRDTMVSPTYDCKGGEKFRVTFEVSSSVQGRVSSSATSDTYLNVAVGFFCYRATGGGFSWPVSTTVTSSSSAPVTAVDSIITLHDEAKRFQAFVQLSGVNSPAMSGTFKIRNLKIYKMYGGELIVDGSVSASAISATSGTFNTANIPNLDAAKITSGSIAADRIKANVINAVNNGTGTINADKINASSLTIGQSQVTNLTSDLAAKATPSDITNAVNAIDVGGRNLLRWTSSPKVNGTYSIVSPSMTDGWYAWNSGKMPLSRTDYGVKVTHDNTTSTESGLIIPLAYPDAVVGGEEVTLSFDYRTNDSSLGYPYLLSQSGSNTRLGKTLSVTTSETNWVHFSETITFPSTSGKVTWALLMPYRAVANGWFEFKDKSVKLEKGNKATDWSAAQEDLEAGLSIGGRNILSGTAAMKVGTGTKATSTFRASGGTLSNVTTTGLPEPLTTGAIRVTNNGSSAAQCGFCQDYIYGSFITGKQYTASAWIRASTSLTNVRFQHAWRTGTQTTGPTATVDMFKVTTSWQKFTFTGTLSGDQADYYSGGYVYSSSLPSGAWFEVCGLKLEEGNQATPWTESPEDVDAGISDAAKTATNYITADATGIRIASTNLATQYQRLYLTSSAAEFYSSDNEKRVAINSSTGVTVGRSDKGHALVNDSGMTIYDTNNKARTVVSSSGLDVRDTDGTTSVANFGSSARIGKASGDRVEIDSTNGITIYKANSKRLQTTANGIDVYAGTTSIASFGSSARIGPETGWNVWVDPYAGIILQRGNNSETLNVVSIGSGTTSYQDGDTFITEPYGQMVIGPNTDFVIKSGQEDVDKHTTQLWSGAALGDHTSKISIRSVRDWTTSSSNFDISELEVITQKGGISPEATMRVISGTHDGSIGVTSSSTTSRADIKTDRLYLNDVGCYMTHGVVNGDQSQTTAANSYKDFSVYFNHTYASAPHVVVGFYSTSTAAGFGGLSCAVNSITTTGCTIRVFNNTSTGRAPGVEWIAIG